jgi:hypothetical protein
MKNKSFNIVDCVAQYGAKNIRIFGPGEVVVRFPYFGVGITDGTVVDRTEFIIDESLRSVSVSNKLILVPQDANLAVERKYQSDFNTMVNRGTYHVYVLTPDGYVPLHVTVSNLS